ncbi:MAG: hypothetical protein AOA65_0105 [Candidatus Bathyarchaeota archaeon BA1]|nr:MAG: hypothetical protein AOA65_0105 [Candidatus Bathyarchaeota archaeon BA1]
MALYEWRANRKEAALTLSTTTTAGMLLSLSFIPPQWLWTFLLMEFIPIAIILGYRPPKWSGR